MFWLTFSPSIPSHTCMNNAASPQIEAGEICNSLKGLEMSPLSSCQSKWTRFKFLHNIYQKFKWLVIKAGLELSWHTQPDTTALYVTLLLLGILLYLLEHQVAYSAESYSLLNSKHEIAVKHNKYFMAWVRLWSSNSVPLGFVKMAFSIKQLVIIIGSYKDT